MPDQPYNSLGQILSLGGDIALGLAIYLGWSDSQIDALFARRFNPMTDDDRDRLINLAKAGVIAAQRLENLGDSDTQPLGEIPVNPQLFGSDPDGKRSIWIVEWSADNGQHWIQQRVTWYDNMSKADLIKQIEDAANEQLRDGSPRLVAIFGQNKAVTSIHFMYEARRY